MGEYNYNHHQTRSQGLPAYSDIDTSTDDEPKHRELGRSGRLASKWIADLVNGSLGDAGLPPCTNPASVHPARHDLYRVLSQSFESSAGWKKERDQMLTVCMCRTCKKTFTIVLKCPTGRRCDKNVQRMHHLVPTAVSDGGSSHSKHYPINSEANFMCSAVGCDLTVCVDVCERRLPEAWEASLVDRDTVRARLEELLQSNDHDRYEDFRSPDKLAKLFPAHYLWQYLSDVLKSGPETAEKKVSYRNKFFTLCFWDRFGDVFDFLEFETVDGDGDQSLVLPHLDEAPSAFTDPVSRRGWFEIVRIHLYFLVVDNLPAALVAPIEMPVNPQIDTIKVLEELLDAKYAKSKQSFGDYNPADFDLLGVNNDIHENMLWYACACQGQTDPTNRELYFEALRRVSQNREGVSPELRKWLEGEELALVIVRSAREAGADPLPKAYRALDSEQSASNEFVLRQFDNKLRSASFPDRKTLRNNLLLIGRNKKDPDIVHYACRFEPEEAMTFLGIPEDAVQDVIPSYVQTNVNEDKSIDRILAAGALRSLTKKYNNHAELEVLAIELEREAGEPWMVDDNSITVALGPPSQTAAGPAFDASLPVGLVNIRNTCYLNSLLQYFNTVLPVRSVVLNWEEYKMEPTEDNIKTRRLGGSGSALDKAEAFLAAKFVEEMRSLFLDLQSSNESAIRPQQRLALAALKTADQLVRGKPAETSTTAIGPQPNPDVSTRDLPPPPPLPARPSPKPPSQLTQPTVTVNAVSEHADTASNVSSSTLVDQRDEEVDQTYVTISQNPTEDKNIPQVVPAKQRLALDDEDKDQALGLGDGGRGRSVGREQDTSSVPDANMGGMDETVTVSVTETKVEQALTVEEKITGALNDVSVTGTEQQDVEEVMGNILEHLHAAIKPTGTDEHTGKQTDIITETFYWSSVKKIRTVDTKNTGKTQSDFRSVPDLSRWMTAFPAKEGKIDLYKALDSNFDQEFQEDGHETYSSITRASPILHVYIQRSQNVDGKLSRNNNVVEIPERLYLDRYMDGDNDSDLFKKRQRSWQLKRRLEALDRPPQAEPIEQKRREEKAKVNEAGYEVIDGNDTVVGAFEKEMMTVEDEDYVSILTPDLQQMFIHQGNLPNPSQPSGEDIAMGGTSVGSLANLSSDASRHLHEFNEDRKERDRKELSTLFSDMTSVSYRLHAVICHGGGLGSGHYWVWIYDFDKNVWRSYNDERVEVHADKDKVLNDLNNGASPYYVAYVREDQVDRLVKIPERNLVTSSEQVPTAAEEVIQSVDIDMQDAAEVSHVEHRE
ncbi:hypothetical protein N8I77_003201 [Diaporthe amygdali]|uniref:ubiquitinyl hydrolase 1 n=1 Tax=Phomopsis amygdali TaxID=1214568 RepID=A0AAD9W4R4_PHOAM|nr:hypothetical protein N8I77_003201 [Diaporthe amygdali]